MHLQIAATNDISEMASLASVPNQVFFSILVVCNSVFVELDVQIYYFLPYFTTTESWH